MNSEPLEDHVEANLAHFVGSITPSQADPTYSVLKAHLLLEELLYDFIMRGLPHPEALRGSRLTFSQLLALSKASATTLKPEDWHWEGVARVNKLRNMLAHQLDAPAAAEKIADLVRFIVSSSGVALPPATDLQAVEIGSAPRYLAIDAVLLALYGVLADRLGFDSRSRLFAEQTRSKALAKSSM